MAGEKIQRISHSFSLRSRVSLLWLAFVLVAGTQGLHSHASTELEQPAWSEKNPGEVFERLCAHPITLQFSGDAKPRSRLGSSSHDAPDSCLTLGASLVRVIPNLAAPPEAPNTLFGSRAELSFSSLSKGSSYRPVEQSPDQTKCSLPLSQRT